MSGVDFLDSIVFIYAVDNASPAKQAIALRLLSEGLQHGQRIEGLMIENPFRP